MNLFDTFDQSRASRTARHVRLEAARYRTAVRSPLKHVPTIARRVFFGRTGIACRRYAFGLTRSHRLEPIVATPPGE